MTHHSSDVIDKLLASKQAPNIPVISQFVDLFDSMGMMGPNGPFMRAGVGAVLGAGAMWALRPSFAFTSDGSPRPWSATGGGAGSTPVTWFVVAGGAAIFCGLFI